MSFWGISKRDLEETKAELRNRRRERDEAEERHRVEISVSYAHTDITFLMLDTRYHDHIITI